MPVYTGSSPRLVTEPDRRLVTALTVVVLTAFTVSLVRTAWLSDDAYITFRTVDNWLAGYGPRWNVDERVQAYTHPLWMLLVSALAAVTHEYYFTVISLSLALSVTTAYVVVRHIAVTPLIGAFAGSLLLGSRAFVDYSTSGLENPLTHLLLALFVTQFLRAGPTHADPLRLGLLAGLVTLNRLDILLIILPALALAAIEGRRKATTIRILLGFAPFVAWEIFSLIYYGSLLPNTAYAKLAWETERWEMIGKGVHYLAWSASRDPLTLPGLALGLSVALWRSRRRELAVAGGLVLYLVYVVAIGGDFMGGRFLAAPYLFAVALVAQLEGRRARQFSVLAAATPLLLSLTAPDAPFVTGKAYGQDLSTCFSGDGVADERCVYYPSSGLLGWRPGRQMPDHRWAWAGREARQNTNSSPTVVESTGYYGFFAGPRVHIVDVFGLADPLLARVPPIVDPRARIGHRRRAIPVGYLESLKSGTNQIEGQRIADFYDRIRLVTRGPLWSAHRWRAILDLALGRLDGLIDVEGFRYPRGAFHRLPKLAPPS